MADRTMLQQVVLDEIAGYLVALAMLCFMKVPTIYGHGATFFFFRLFDVIKPAPARQFEAIEGAPGIMLDDLAAGYYGVDRLGKDSDNSQALLVQGHPGAHYHIFRGDVFGDVDDENRWQASSSIVYQGRGIYNMWPTSSYNYLC